jgi:phosphoribosylanthranilate isomerase
MLEIIPKFRGRGGFLTLSGFPNIAGILLDSGTPEERGGTGKTFAWGEAHSFVSAVQTVHHVVIAGGLTPANVGWAVDCLKPWGVDVASGVEAQPGKKDPEKVRAFVKAVREMDKKTG